MDKMVKALNKAIYIWNMRVRMCRMFENVTVSRAELFSEDCPLCEVSSSTCSDCPIRIVEGTTCSWTPYKAVHLAFIEGTPTPTGATLLPLVQAEVKFLQEVKRKYKERLYDQ